MKHIYILAGFISLFIAQKNIPTSCCTSSGSESVSSCYDSSGPRSIYVMRSAGANTARELVGWQNRINAYDKDYEGMLWGSSTFAVEYQKTFDPEAIAQELFGTSVLNFKGSQVASRTSADLVADYFGLPTTYEGAVSFSPVIKTWTGEYQVYFGLDRWLCGLYARFNAPLVWTNWNLRACTKDVSLEQPLFDPGYMGIASKDPFTSPIASLPNLREALIGYVGFGDKDDARHYGNIDFNGKTVVRIADIDMILGWNFLASENYHLGFNSYFVLPLGNKPCPATVFSPVVGNGKHYELGAGISGHLTFWQSCSGSSLGVYIEGNCTHLFRNIQQRSFDFCQNGPLSRYLLLKQFGTLKKGDVPADANAYENILVDGIDWSTRYASVSIPCKVDVTVKFAVQAAWFGLDLGYNIYGQKQEKVKLLPNYPTIYMSSRLGMKGLLGTNYFVRTADAESVTAVGTLNSTASGSKIGVADFNDLQTTNNPVFIQNPGTYGTVVLGEGQYGVNWHNQNSASAQTADQAQQNNSAAYYSGAGYPNQTNPGPDILELEDLSTYSGSGHGFITNKFFGFISYNGKGCYEPFLGIGGDVEFEWGNHEGAHNQWGFLIKGGMAF